MTTYQVIETVWERKFRFVGVFFIVFTLTYTVLYVVDFLPEPPNEATEPSEQLTTPETEPLNVEIIEEVAVAKSGELTQRPASAPAEPILPTEIYIEKLDKTIAVFNPTSRLIADLDAALLNGVVRHPDSATLDQEGNVFILGHSSYLPNVLNRNFQAFNGIQTLAWGDTITVSGGDSTYVYRVEKVYEAKASEVVVPIAGTGNMLTLATCDSFGSTDDRYIVEASLLRVSTV